MDKFYDWMKVIRKEVLERDGKCKRCGTTEDLMIRCVREWHRNHPDSWICLCTKCRSEDYEKKRKTALSAKNPQKRILARKVEELLDEVKILRTELARTKDRLRAYERNR
jgi:predicted nucleic-acid-binding Zn-ribbon protein